MTRTKRDDALRKEQLSLIELVEAWTRLKALREKNGFNSTSCHLVLGAQSQERQQDLDRYQQGLQEELEEREMLFTLDAPERQDQHRRDTARWHAALADWEQAQREADAAIRDLKHVVSQETARLAAQPAPTKPDPPRVFDRREELRLIQDRIALSRRRPGDPVYVPQLRTDLPTTATVVCTATERNRRADVDRQQLFLRVIMVQGGTSFFFSFFFYCASEFATDISERQRGLPIDFARVESRFHRIN